MGKTAISMLIDKRIQFKLAENWYEEKKRGVLEGNIGGLGWWLRTGHLAAGIPVVACLLMLGDQLLAGYYRAKRCPRTNKVSGGAAAAVAHTPELNET